MCILQFTFLIFGFYFLNFVPWDIGITFLKIGINFFLCTQSLLPHYYPCIPRASSQGWEPCWDTGVASSRQAGLSSNQPDAHILSRPRTNAKDDPTCISQWQNCNPALKFWVVYSILKGLRIEVSLHFLSNWSAFSKAIW